MQIDGDNNNDSIRTESAQPSRASANGSAAAETVERRMWVGLTAAGFNGRFEIPEKHFNDLLTWLAERSCGQEKQPNAESSDLRDNPKGKI